jgi:hemolysin activation/secretion protein
MDASYTLPLNTYDTTLGLRYQRNETIVVEAPFQDLDIESESEVFSLLVRHPVYRTVAREFTVLLSGERLHNQTRLLGEPFDFSAGAQDGDGETTDTALRLSSEWLDRTQTQVIAIRSRFSIGLDILGATMTEDGDSDIPDGRFFAWLGQLQWVRRMNVFGLQDFQLLFRLDVQISKDPLLPLEQIAVGGRFSVRGYRENQLVRDNGVIVSLESRIPLLDDKRWADLIELAPFFDFGHAYNTAQATPDLTTVYSIGIGLRWALTFPKPIPWRSQLEVYWGYPLKDADTGDENLQDRGLHLQFVFATL